MKIEDLGIKDRHVMAIVPHQDDELIGMGGTLAYAAQEAKSLHLVLVTDGAADAGFLSVRGIWKCTRLSEFAEFFNAEELQAHDEGLVEEEDGTWWHSPPNEIPFFEHSDSEREPGFGCPTWGKQRDFEFLHVTNALGIPRDSIQMAFWDPDSPLHIKDGQIAINGRPLSEEEMSHRYARVAEYYIRRFSPDIICTMAPYENRTDPNDHRACALGVQKAAEELNVPSVLYHHSGFLYRQIYEGGASLGEKIVLPESCWNIKRAAIPCYFRWNPARGWFATAAHSVPQTFRAILKGNLQSEYISFQP